MRLLCRRRVALLGLRYCQLASIERGGLCAELRQRHGAAEITEVTWQKADWQRRPPAVTGGDDRHLARGPPIRASPASWTVFMVAAERRFGEESMWAAFRAAHEGRMSVPSTGREHRDALDELARSFALGRHAITDSAAGKRRLGREAREAERERTRAEERQRTGLPPLPRRAA